MTYRYAGLRRIALTTFILAAAAACGADDSAGSGGDGGGGTTGSTGSTGSSSGGGGEGGSAQGGSGQGGGTPEDTGTDFDYTPSNLEGVNVDVAGPDVVLDNCDDPWIDTSSGAFPCGESVAFETIDQGPGWPDIAVFHLNSLHITSGTEIGTRGNDALALVVRGDVIIEGTLYVTGDHDCGINGVPGGYRGGLANYPQGGTGDGPGGGPGGSNLGGGAGGTFGGIGGDGANAELGALGGLPVLQGYGDPTLIPLVGGSGGGASTTEDCGGAGGGALVLASSTSIIVALNGGITAGGRGGWKGGGGGSGGAILLEGPAVTVDGVVAANGGGGGASHSGGCSGKISGLPACGADGFAATGGVGSSAINPDAGNGTVSTNQFACSGGGGGGAGRIRINTMDGAATIGGTVSPAASTSLFTEGVIAP